MMDLIEYERTAKPAIATDVRLQYLNLSDEPRNFCQFSYEGMPEFIVMVEWEWKKEYF